MNESTAKSYLRLLNSLNAIDGIDVYDHKDDTITVACSREDWNLWLQGLTTEQVGWLIRPGRLIKNWSAGGHRLNARIAPFAPHPGKAHLANPDTLSGRVMASRFDTTKSIG